MVDKPVFIVSLLRLVNIIVNMSYSKVSVSEMSKSLTILVNYLIGHNLDVFESIRDYENKVLVIQSNKESEEYKELRYEVRGDNVYMENDFINELCDDIVKVFATNYIAGRGFTLEGNSITRSDRPKTCKIPPRINSTENLALLKAYVSNYVVDDLSMLVDHAKIIMDTFHVNTVDVTDSRNDSALRSVGRITNFNYGYSHECSNRSEYSLFCPLLISRHEISRMIVIALRDIYNGEYRFSNTKIPTDDTKGLIVKINRH